MPTYYLFRVAAAIVPLMPLWLGYWLADVAAEISYRVWAGARRNVRGNQRRVLGSMATDADVERVTRQVFHSAAKNYYDLFRLPKLGLEELRRIVKVYGIENLVECLRDGKGVIIFAPHLGSFDLVAQIALVYSYKITIPVERIKPQKLFDLVTSTRGANGVQLVPVGGGALKHIYRALSGNEIVAIAADRDVLKNGIPVKFFGAETTIPEAPAVLAQRTGASLLPACCVRNGDGTYEIHLEPRLILQTSDNAREDVRVNSQTVAQILEKFIQRYPEQWVAFDAIWKN
ncbi:MAG: hypothetical protein HYY30_01080 [Chloroflexi bacterium]|nr:hypothetical protein [Chloroflexota bacterium]